ncbi:MAG: radical SAM protein [Opitutales bacterium]|nr:radical SAM protein [Opitutales bacterium]
MQSTKLDIPFQQWAPGAFISRSDRPLCLYVHIPFCRHRCLFCPFYRYATHAGFSAEYAELLLKEIALTADALGKERHQRRVDAVYFGGGTPSDLSGTDLAAVIESLRSQFSIDSETEITVEGRIRGFTSEKVEAWRKAGANRVSIGLQSTDTAFRRRLGRLADRKEILETLHAAKNSGVILVADLIYGLPGQTSEMIAEDIRFLAEESPVDGLDLYALKAFADSPLLQQIDRGRLPPLPGTVDRAQLFRRASVDLDQFGFEHFTRQHWRREPGERSLYNRLAKGDSDILPFGSAAGGRIGPITLMQEPTMESYRKQVLANEKPVHARSRSQPISEREQFAQTLSHAVEHRQLPPLKAWPKTPNLALEDLILNWRYAGLLTAVPECCHTPISLSSAGSYWALHLRDLALKACFPES